MGSFCRPEILMASTLLLRRYRISKLIDFHWTVAMKSFNYLISFNKEKNIEENFYFYFTNKTGQIQINILKL